MVQMTAQDQAIVKALPGNSSCCDCGMKNPQWASISFGNVFCLECSGVHRSLGVHISFVRSIAMDSWTDQQLKQMKMGGNEKCNSFLAAKGIDKRTPIKQKYESDAAQLYKHVLKARVEGQPEPTVLPKPAPKSGGSAHAGTGGSQDSNGMERLTGETDQQYIARQTRLREEAKARMAAKFGGSGMGGVGSGGRSSMQGIGSDPGYDPNRSAASGGFDMGMGSLASGLGSVVGMASSVTSSVLSTDNVNVIASTGASFWGSLTGGIATVANTVVGVDDNDGLADLQRQVSSQKPLQSKYGGFGSESVTRSSVPSSFSSAPTSGGGGGGGLIQEAQGLPGEDRNGIGRLTGESDQQYVMRQTRLRDEARARMAAKFGGQSLTSASSTSFGGVPSATSTSSSSSAGVGPVTEAPGLPGEDRNGITRLTGESDDQYVMRQTRLRDEAKARMAAKFGSSGVKLTSASSTGAPSSANGSSWYGSQPTKTAPQRSVSGDKNVSADDFFSSFGT